MPENQTVLKESFTAEEWSAGLVESQVKTMAMLFAALGRNGVLSVDGTLDYLADLARDTPYPAAAAVYHAIAQHIALAYPADLVPEAQN